MIRLNKGVEPSILSQKFSEWTKLVVSKIAAGTKPTKSDRTRYNHPEIKRALVARNPRQMRVL